MSCICRTEKPRIRLAPLTLLLFLPERDHLVELSLNQAVPLVLIQPHAARKRLLDARERTVHDHLWVGAARVTADVTGADGLQTTRVCGTFSQYQPAPTAPLSWPMVILLRGLIRSQISTLKMSMRPRSKAPPSRKTLPLFFKPL